MASNNLAKSLKRSALTAAIGLCFVGGVQAQSNTGGAITGQANAGDTITVTNPANGYSRTITTGSDGNYRFSQLQTGNYTVTRNGGEARETTVRVGTGSTVNFGGTLGTVTVVGSNQINPIDVSSVESTTILTNEQIRKIPVPENTTAVALLAPGTVRGDSAFGNLASFGGASVSENQYFINGFNVTNSFQRLNFAQIPYEAIAEQQVKTGGYGAEFGNSTGGIINQITKRGTNEFHAGGKVVWDPRSLQETQPNTYLNDGTLVSNNKNDKTDNLLYTLWAGGALIKDRLFAYGLVQYSDGDTDAFGSNQSSAFNTRVKSKEPKWLLKLDWNINDNNLLEFTGMGDKRRFYTDYYTSTLVGDTQTRGAYQGTQYNVNGGEAYVLKYTGYLTDTFTLSALYGHSTSDRTDYSVTAGGIRNEYNGDVGGPVPGCPRVIDNRPDVVAGNTAPYTHCELARTLGRPDGGDTRDQFRIDAEWQLGDHLVRGGIDTDDFKSVAGQSYYGGALYVYFADDYGIDYRFQSGANVEVKQRAYYIEDSWSVTDNFLLYAGLRWDNFDNKNGDGETYVKINNQFAPRLGFSWDVFGDASFKVFGNAGRYALPIAGTVAVRGASKSLFQYDVFTYDGVDPATGAPQNYAVLQTGYLNNEFGIAKDPRSIASKNLKPMYQDEYILGFQKQLTDNFTVGVRGIYRNLKRGIDDTCDYRAVVSWAIDNGFDVNPVNGTNQAPNPAAPNEIAHYNAGFPNCRLYNPGQPGIYEMDVNGDGVFETVTVPASYTIVNRTVNGQTVPLVVPNDDPGQKAKRTYSALEFFFQGSWDKFFFQGSYTYANNRGNTEGGVKSDIGQADTGTTQDFDYPELIVGSYGYLPNDRRHTLKLFGAWDITDEWRVGANLLVQSGRPINCIGVYGNDPAGYRSSYFSCDPGLPTSGRDNGTTIVPRGSAGRLPWQRNLDMNVRYAPSWAEGLSFKVDVFNVLNSKAAINVNENFETSVGRPDPNNYKRATGFQNARAVRFTARYEF